ncbi:hypothetical protein ABZP36_003498 [Zizania latifolia]
MGAYVSRFAMKNTALLSTYARRRRLFTFLFLSLCPQHALLGAVNLVFVVFRSSVSGVPPAYAMVLEEADVVDLSAGAVVAWLGCWEGQVATLVVACAMRAGTLDGIRVLVLEFAVFYLVLKGGKG